MSGGNISNGNVINVLLLLD